MTISISENAYELGKAAGKVAGQFIQEAIEARGTANIILATGTSQFSTISELISAAIDWSKVTMFHLDEYIGLPVTHPASFRKYLQEKFLSKLPPLKYACLINGEVNPEQECDRLGALIASHPIDLALVGIGENGHLAFNDPPADFETARPYIIVELDEACRKQQWGEGWFNCIDEVPRRAISMSVKQILQSTHIICSVPDSRKALAVKNTLEQQVSTMYPASILQTHPDCRLYLDENAAALLSKDIGVSL